MRPFSVFPVVHVKNYEQAVREADLALTAGADGLFFINHSQSAASLAKTLERLRQNGLMNQWTGANFLEADLKEALDYAGALKLDALWTDNVGVHASEHWQETVQTETELRRSLAPSTLLFGGVAFKYQLQRVDPAVEAADALPYVDVVTTSGPGTAASADLAKLASMRKAIGDAPMAVASGVTPENAAEQFAYVDAVLVASGISHDWHRFDVQRMKALLTERDRLRSEQ